MSDKGTGVHPPRPRLVFRVGMVGHRPGRLLSADIGVLRGRLKEILERVGATVVAFGAMSGEWFNGEKPVVRVITSLAEGTDRLIAEAMFELRGRFGEGLEWQMCCPLPFAQEEFEKDFMGVDKDRAVEALRERLEGDSVKRFRGILEKARGMMKVNVFEMDGERGEGETAAYAAASRVLVNQSDLVVAVWDGVKKMAAGGTEDSMLQALRREIPVVWVDAKSPHGFGVYKEARELESGSSESPGSPAGGSMEKIEKYVWGALALPEPQGSEKKKHGGRSNPAALRGFYREGRPRWNAAVAWKCFRDVVGDFRWPRLSVRTQDYEEAVAGEWKRIVKGPAGSRKEKAEGEATAMDRVYDFLRPFFAWTDQLAVRYSDTYRSAFLVCFGFAALAVGVALVPIAFHLESPSPRTAELLLISGELVLIVAIMLIFLVGRHRRWHERWIDYRLAAELIRHCRLVLPLGGGRPFPQPLAHLTSYGTLGSTWIAWYVRAVERDLGLPEVKLTEAYVDGCRREIMRELREQILFHRATMRRAHRIEERLHWVGLMCLGITAIGCIGHLVLALVPEEGGASGEVATTVSAGAIGGWHLAAKLTFIGGALPALGAAVAGINNQGEFVRISKRSAGMRQLIAYRWWLRGLRPGSRGATGSGRGYSEQVEGYAGDAARLMVTEVLDWRVVVLDRPLLPPT